MSRTSWLGQSTRMSSVVRPSRSVSVSVFTVNPASAAPSYTSVETIRSFGTISRYSPWNATSKPPCATITYRHMPPTRKSISALVTWPRWPLHQRLTSSGVVHARYTRCLGASNSRTIRICVSLGSVTAARRLVAAATMFVLLGFEVFQHFVHRVEPLAPRPLELLHPVVDRPERLAMQPVEPLPPGASGVHQAHLPQDPQVLRDLGLSQPEQRHEVVHRALAGGQDVQDLAPPRLCYGVEGVRGRGCAGHGDKIYPYRNMSRLIDLRIGAPVIPLYCNNLRREDQDGCGRKGTRREDLMRGQGVEWFSEG